MSVANDFKSFLDNLKIKNPGQISKRYRGITKVLNKHFRDSDSETSYSLQSGSYGRFTGVNGISDLDMLYIMPNTEWPKYRNNPSKLLDVCRTLIKQKYSRTEINKDRNVVVVNFGSFMFEVVPVFEQGDGTFKYPDTYNGGSWPLCNPRAELAAFKEMNEMRSRHLRRLCKMVRAWRKRHEIRMSGFLSDTLCYNFFKNNHSYDKRSFRSYNKLVEDFFTFLAAEPQKKYYLAPGSNAQVKVKTPFQKVASETKDKCIKANAHLDKEEFHSANVVFKQVFGRPFPNYNRADDRSAATVQLIEHFHEQHLTHQIVLECEVSNDPIVHFLSRLNISGGRLKSQRNLRFYIADDNIQGPFTVKWKVLNQGDEARKRGQVRGGIIADDGTKTRREVTSFFGDHIVECYAIQNDIVVARDRIIVPIE